jgi:hypothetical protein
MDYRPRRRLYRLLLNKLRLPRRIATAIVKGFAHAADPGAAGRRRAAAAAVADPTAIGVPEADGYRILGPGELPGTDALVMACRRLFDAARARGALAAKVEAAPKQFLLPVADRSDALLAEPAIRDFVLSPAVLSTVARYFGRMPILSEIALLWTPVNATRIKSQEYHFDTEDYRQLKLFIYISEVSAETGPITLIGARRSAEVGRVTGYVGGRHRRLKDAAIVSAGADKDAVRIVGPAGGGVFMDTSRCLHFGSRGNRAERLVLLIQFMDYYAPKLEPTDWRAAAAGFAGGLDEARRLLLRC